MGKRDAFGNEIDGDDPLDAMGWKVGEGAAQAPTSVPGLGPAAPVAQAPPVAPSPPPFPATSASVSADSTPRFDVPTLATQLPNIPGSSRGFQVGPIFGRLVGLVIFLAIAGGVAYGVIGALDTANEVRKAFTVPQFTVPGATPATETPANENQQATPEQPAKPASPPSGLQPASLLRADEFGKALVKMRAQGGRVQTMRLDPTRISANLLNNANSLRIFSTTWDGAPRTVKTSSVLTGVQTVSLAAITSKAPSRAVARAASLLGRTAKQVNYVVLLNFAGNPTWMVYFKDGKYVRASLDGRQVQRVN